MSDVQQRQARTRRSSASRRSRVTAPCTVTFGRAPCAVEDRGGKRCHRARPDHVELEIGTRARRRRAGDRAASRGRCGRSRRGAWRDARPTPAASPRFHARHRQHRGRAGRSSSASCPAACASARRCDRRGRVPCLIEHPLAPCGQQRQRGVAVGVGRRRKDEPAAVRPTPQRDLPRHVFRAVLVVERPRRPPPAPARATSSAA